MFVCVHIYIHIYTCVCEYICIYTYIYVCVCVCVYIYIYIYIYTCMCVCVCIYIYTHIYTCMHGVTCGVEIFYEGQALRARLCCRKLSDSIFWLYYFTPS